MLLSPTMIHPRPSRRLPRPAPPPLADAREGPISIRPGATDRARGRRARRPGAPINPAPRANDIDHNIYGSKILQACSTRAAMQRAEGFAAFASFSGTAGWPPYP